MDDEPFRLLRRDALANIDAAIAASETLGETVAACYLQMGADLLRAHDVVLEPANHCDAVDAQRSFPDRF